MALAFPVSPEALHPALWLASQLARGTSRCVDTGYAALSAELPGGGWPTGALIDLLLQQPGIGELRLLRPALTNLAGVAGAAKRRIVLLQPPHTPQCLALAGWGLPPSQLVWIRSGRSADALWAAEQVLRSGSCGALLFWQNHVRAESLRRLHLAAQNGETLFCMMRPLASAQDASPAVLRLTLRPAVGGIDIGFAKRRGPQRDASLFLPLLPSPVLLHEHKVPQPASQVSASAPAFSSVSSSPANSSSNFSSPHYASLDRASSATASARSVLPELVER